MLPEEKYSIIRSEDIIFQQSTDEGFQNDVVHLINNKMRVVSNMVIYVIILKPSKRRTLQILQIYIPTLCLMTFRKKVVQTYANKNTSELGEHILLMSITFSLLLKVLEV